MSIQQTSETSTISKLKITGFKANKGQMDNGTKFDSTKVFAETRLDESKGNMRGTASTEYNIGLSDEYEKYANIPLPFIAEVEIETVTNGKTRSQNILQLIPLKSVAPTPRASGPTA